MNHYTLHKTINTNHGHTSHLELTIQTVTQLQIDHHITINDHNPPDKITHIIHQINTHDPEKWPNTPCQVHLQPTEYGLAYSDYAESEITDEILQKDQQEALNKYNNTISNYQKQGWTVTYTGHNPQGQTPD